MPCGRITGFDICKVCRTELKEEKLTEALDENGRDPALKRRTEILHTLLLVLTAAIWGAAFVAQSVGAQYVGAFTFLTARSWIGFIFLIPLILIREKPGKRNNTEERKVTKMQKKTLIIGGAVCGIFLFSASAAQQIGIATTSTAKSGFITAMYVVLVPIISIFLGHRPDGKIWCCVILGVIGLYLLCVTGSLSLSPGDSLTLLCALLFSFQILAVTYYTSRLDAVKLAAVEFLTEAILSTAVMLIFEKPVWSDIVLAGPAILYAGIMSSGVAYTLQIIAQRGLSPTVASLAMCLESVFSAIAGWIVLGQTLTVREFAGCLLMFAAIIISQLPGRPKTIAVN